MSVGVDRVASALRGAGEGLTDPDLLEGYRYDQSSRHFLSAGTPTAVVRPTRTEEVQAAVRAARRLGVPIVPRGAGSGLTGGANAIDGCIVVSLERMDEIRRIDTGSLTATVGPGVLNEELRRAVARHGLWYAPDPASAEFCSIGGNVATNAGGLCCVKYGVTRDWLLGLEVVLADGDVVRVGRRTRKGVAGYDLAALMCGSEGTLGIITEATMRLQPVPPHATTVAATFTSLTAAGDAASRVMHTLTPSLLELVDAQTLAAIQQVQPIEIEPGTAAMMFARTDSGGARSVEEAQLIAAAFEAAGAATIAISDDEAEGRMLMSARRLALPSLERLGATLLDDVCVPLRDIPRFLDAVQTTADRHGLLIGTVGHAGDGNMHPIIVYDPGDPDQTRTAVAAFQTLLELALDLGGTIAGEHGIGTLKRAQLPSELGSSMRLHQAIKQTFDPRQILNPGKAI